MPTSAQRSTWYWWHLRREEFEDVWKGKCSHELHILMNPSGYRANPNNRKVRCPSCEKDASA